MPVPSKVLVFLVPMTCMGVYCYDNSVLYLWLVRYEGWPVEMFYLDIVCAPKSLVCDVQFLM